MQDHLLIDKAALHYISFDQTDNIGHYSDSIGKIRNRYYSG